MLTGAPRLFRWALWRQVVERGVGAKTGEEMEVEFGSGEGSKQPVVAKPTVCNHQDRCCQEMSGNRVQHFGRLRHFGLKGDGFTGFFRCDLLRIDILSQKIKSERQRQTAPPALDDFQQTDGNDILRPGIGGLIKLGGMVMKETAAEDLASGFVIDGIIECYQQPALNGGLWDEAPEELPQTLPRHFWRSHEGVKTPASHIQAKQRL